MLKKWLLPASALASGVGMVGFGYLAIRIVESRLEERKESSKEHFPLTGRDTTTYERLSLNDVYTRYKIKTLDKKLQKGKVLGEGSYAHVIGCTEVTTGKSVALKVVKKAFTKAIDFEREVSALTAARIHPNIVQLLDVIDVPDADSWLLVTELLEGGELFDRILQRGAFSERSAALLIRKIASALSCLHRLGWTHNDVKPENIVYCTKDPDSDVKLIDFGMARRHPGAEGYSEKQLASKDLGTTAYWSPEILDPRTRFSSDPRMIDAWTLGVLTYILLFGCHPFDRSGDASEETVAQRIGEKDPETGLPRYLNFDCFGSDYVISANARKFLVSLMTHDPNKRMTVEEVLEHDWIIDTLQSPEDEPQGVANEPKGVAHERRLRGEREAQAALTALLKVATMGSAARDSYYNSIIGESPQQQADDDPLKDFKFELDKRRLRTYNGIVYDVGDVPTGMYVVVKGRALLEYPSETVVGDKQEKTHMTVHVLGPGDLFGETAILEGRSHRNARIRTVGGPMEAYFFSRDDVVAVLSASIELKERLDELSARRYRLRAANALMTHAKNNESLGKTLRFAKGEKVFSKGEPAKHIYLVKSGVVKSIVSESANKAKKDSLEPAVSAPSSTLERALGTSSKQVRAASRVVIGEWGPGDVFGISALYGSPRFASAVAQTPVEVIEVKREDLERVLEHEPMLRENLAQQFRTFKERSASIARKHTRRKSELAKRRMQRLMKESEGQSSSSSSSSDSDASVHSDDSASTSSSSGSAADAAWSSKPSSSEEMDESVIVLKKGEVLFRKGDSSETGVFFVQEGMVHLVDSSGNVRYSNGAGQTFGTESFIRGTPRRYTAVVASDVVKLMKVKVRGTGDYDEDDVVVIGIDENTPSAST